MNITRPIIDGGRIVGHQTPDGEVFGGRAAAEKYWRLRSCDPIIRDFLALLSQSPDPLLARVDLETAAAIIRAWEERPHRRGTPAYVQPERDPMRIADDTSHTEKS